MSDNLVRYEEPSRVLARFGTDQEVRMLMRRQAAIYGIPDADIQRPDVQAALAKATQISIQYGYLPGVHIHMISFRKQIGGQWVDSPVPDIGEKSWKDSADKAARMDHFRYMVETEPLTSEQVRELSSSEQYHPDDRGFRARVLRTDHIEVMKAFGKEYDPEWSYGFWRKKAREKDEWRNGRKTGQKTWEPDTTPNGRRPEDVAERRAYKAALMKVFSLVPLDEYNENRHYQALRNYVLEETEETKQLASDTAPVHRNLIQREEDGSLLFDTDEPPADGAWRAAEPPASTADEEWGDIPAAPQAQTNGTKAQETRQAALIWATTGDNVGVFDTNADAAASYDRLDSMHPDVSLRALKAMWGQLVEAYRLAGLIDGGRLTDDVYGHDLNGLKALVAELTWKLHDVSEPD